MGLNSPVRNTYFKQRLGFYNLCFKKPKNLKKLKTLQTLYNLNHIFKILVFTSGLQSQIKAL